tara:strand:- start:51777 stop:52343 length:567 start_codon:yes stop_codon:yes gene_type:complete
MSSTIYKEFAVFTTGINNDINGIGVNLFDEGTEIVMVLSASYENNVDATHAKWHCDYIGTASDMLSDYVPKMVRYFDTSHARAAFLKNGEAFSRHISKLYMAADPVTLNELSQRGIMGYSWSIEEYEHANIGQEPIEYEYFSTKRAGFLLGSEEDLEIMIKQSLMIRLKAKNHVWAGRPWLAVSNGFH